MEWVLQVADEVDDAVGALRLFAMSWSEDIGLTLASSAAAGAVLAAFLRGFGG
jgi:hypothetical protein